MSTRFVLYLLFSFSFLSAQIRITEIMYDLVGSDSPNEFVEIYNSSETDSINLSGWTIRDKYSQDELEDSGYGLILPPLAFGIIFEGDYNFNFGVYTDSIPADVVLIKVDDSSIGNGLSTNDSLYIISGSGNAEDSLGWTDVAEDGHSLEKIRIERPNSPENWSQSLVYLGTPGKINSVEPLETDGLLFSDSLIITPDIAEIGATVTVHGFVGNVGRNSFDGEIEIRENGYILESISLTPLDELDTVEFIVDIGPFSSGSHELQVVLLVANDGDETNNSVALSLGVRYPFGLFSLNEFMPRPESGKPEFMELYYEGIDVVSLNNWGISDKSGNPILLPNVEINGENYIVIGADSTLLSSVPDTSVFLTPLGNFPVLNNNGDAIYFYDPFNTIIDSLTYLSSWGFSQGQSMEKVFPTYSSSDSASWLPSTNPNGMTPGSRNSVMPWEFDGAIMSSLIAYTPLIPVQTDSIYLVIPVINLGQNTFSANLYAEYLDEELAASDFTVYEDTVFAGLHLPPLPPGEHELFVALDVMNDGNILNNFGMAIIQVRYPFGTIKINEFMARPNNDQSEFIEAISFADFFMSEWFFGDNSMQKKILPSIQVLSGDYIFMTQDSALYPLQNEGAHFLVSSNGWTSLNNTGDAIFLYDHTGSVIDSLHYNIEWQIADEISTEKLRPEFESSHANNWKISQNVNGATPGFANSIALFDLDGAMISDSIWHEPFYPANDETVIVYPMFTNAGVTPFTGKIRVMVDGEEYGSSEFSEISPRDTAVLGLELGPFISGYHSVNLTLSISGDENSSNDISQDSVLVSYDFGVVVINEFLTIPDSTQTEFAELIVIEPVVMNDWSLSDNSFSKKKFSFGNGTKSEGYLVLAADSLISSLIVGNALWGIPYGGFPGLNNTADGIYLFDMTGVIIDSLVYNENWGIAENRSLEKYRPEFLSADSSRWAVAVNEDGQTPGEVNSIFYAELWKEGSLVIEPNPFSPDGDSVDDILYFKYKLPFEYGIISIQIFDVIGRTIAVPYWNVFTPQENILSWDGRREKGEPARVGRYIIKVKAKESSGGKTWENIQTIVLAKQL